MENINFIPVLLASDINVYSMARAFHEEYGIKSLMVARARGGITGKGMTNLFEYIEEPRLDETEYFLKTMDMLCDKYSKNKTLLLIACADHYVRLVVENRDYLKNKGFVLPYTTKEIMNKLVLKESFYELCDKYGLDYPKTFVYSPEMDFEFELEFGYPVVLKASDSVKYHKHKFQGFHKAYFIDSEKALLDTLKLIYGNGYDGRMIIQEMVPGADSLEYDLHMYIGSDHKIKLMDFGNVLLEEHTPTAVGNNAATLTTYNEELMLKVGRMMEQIGWEGFADADIKYDSRDGKYKLFEINVRQGRSNYRVTGAGNNLAKLVVEDYIYRKELPMKLVKEPHFWHVVPLGVVYKYVEDPEKLAIVRKLVAEGKVCDSANYKADMPLKRRLYLAARAINFYRKFKKYYPK